MHTAQEHVSLVVQSNHRGVTLQFMNSFHCRTGVCDNDVL